jgi:GrpB-like predicted nucleotidyltransferase (UPF0157 family)
MKNVIVVPHDPRWRDSFEAEAKDIVVDLLVEVRDLAGLDARSPAMESLGYEAMGEYGIPGRRYFRKADREGIRTHHVHASAAGSAQVVRHLAFRDYMIAHPADAETYSELKRKLAAEHPRDIDGYMDGKDGFIREMDRRAAEWRASS